jgi:hypothetical protein
VNDSGGKQTHQHHCQSQNDSAGKQIRYRCVSNQSYCPAVKNCARKQTLWHCLTNNRQLRIR